MCDNGRTWVGVGAPAGQTVTVYSRGLADAAWSREPVQAMAAREDSERGAGHWTSPMLVIGPTRRRRQGAGHREQPTCLGRLVLGMSCSRCQPAPASPAAHLESEPSRAEQSRERVPARRHMPAPCPPRGAPQSTPSRGWPQTSRPSQATAALFSSCHRLACEGARRLVLAIVRRPDRYPRTASPPATGSAAASVRRQYAKTTPMWHDTPSPHIQVLAHAQATGANTTTSQPTPPACQ